MRFANRLPNQAILAVLDPLPEQTVLDLGCGDGTLIASLPPSVWSIGIDRSEAMIAVARRRNGKAVRVNRCRLLTSDILDLPLDDGSVDRIVASNVLYFCRDVPRLITECRRVARPGARLIIYVTAEATMRNWRFACAATHRHFSATTLMTELHKASIDPQDISLTRMRLPANVQGLLAVIRLSPAA